jgi:hypothetical protein
MPMGFSGMELGDSKEPYEVFAISKDGNSVHFAIH